MTSKIIIECDSVSSIDTTLHDNQVKLILANVNPSVLHCFDAKEIIGHIDAEELLNEMGSVYGIEFIKSWYEELGK